MRISAFLQLYNEHSNGHLRRCLDNCSRWADAIYIYDDCSTDDSPRIYLQYTPRERIIFGKQREFNREIFHKQELLSLVQSDHASGMNETDWIAWIDGDAVFDRQLTEGMRGILGGLEEDDFDSASARNLNLWRSESFFRLDSKFYGWCPVCFWRLSPALRYEPAAGLHLNQFPLGLAKTALLPHNILHYGFASWRGIARKYLTYKSLGQSGNDLDRLIDEEGLRLEKLSEDLYPDGLIPEGHEEARAPLKISYEDVRQFGSVEEWQAAGRIE